MAIADLLDEHDALGLAGLVRERQVTPLELLEASCARIEARDGALNAVVLKLFERARARASSLEAAPGAGERAQPFRGVPFLLKDLLQTIQGVPSSCGSRLLARTPAPHDSELLRRFELAGLVVAAKTNTPELGLLPVTEPELWGACRNPWSTKHTPGGSSGGSAAAVAAGYAPMAHGGDGGGSLRIPASCCGLFALKPSRGRNPLGPDLGEGWNGIVVEHVLTRSVRDSAAALDAVSGPDAGAPYSARPPERPFLEEVSREPGRLRIAFSDRSLLGARVHADCQAAVRDAAALCESLGHHVEEAHPPIDAKALSRAYLTIIAAATAAELVLCARFVGRAATPADVEGGTWMLAQIGAQKSAVELELALHTVHAAGRDYARWAQSYDALLTPTLGAPPLAIGALAQRPAEKLAMRALRTLPLRFAMARVLEQIADTAFEFAGFTAPANLFGLPAMSVPLFFSDGLPIGVQFIGPPDGEPLLLRLAGQLERARPWFERRPPAYAPRSGA
jgi:amidase